jgi:DNA mismatch repair ATPase MutL
MVLLHSYPYYLSFNQVSYLADYLVEGSNSEFRTAEVNPCINLNLSPNEVRILSSFQHDFEKLGLQFEVADDTNIQITKVPTCLLAREQREVGSNCS